MLLLKCCFTSTETIGLLGTGAQDGHLDFHGGGLVEGVGWRVGLRLGWSWGGGWGGGWG